MKSDNDFSDDNFATSNRGTDNNYEPSGEDYSSEADDMTLKSFASEVFGRVKLIVIGLVGFFQIYLFFASSGHK